MPDVSSLRSDLEIAARGLGADTFGVADLAPARDLIALQASKVRWKRAESIVTRLPRAISLGIRLSDGMVESIDPDLTIAGSPYGHHIYQVVSPHMDVIALRLVGILQRHGYQAFPIASSQPVGQTEGLFSHKLAANLAGVGWIGKSCLLISPEFGPRIRFSTVLTDAPLDTGRPLRKRCGKCRDCVDACPVGAFTGVEFRSSDPREIRFDAAKCAAFRNGDPATNPRQTRGCGLCIAACPVGKDRRLGARGL